MQRQGFKLSASVLESYFADIINSNIKDKEESNSHD